MQKPAASIGSVPFNGENLAFIAGPCALENETHAMKMAEQLTLIFSDLKTPFVFKTSFDKANRTSINSPRGVGIKSAIPVFAKIREQFKVPVLTDVHEPWQCEELKGVIDCLQIPAFLCRQTDLLVAAAKTNLTVNIKKGQFLAPWDMVHPVNKVRESGNKNIILTERGSTFGYNTLVVDYRALPQMRESANVPIVMDATHAVQQPGGKGTSSGGDRRFVPALARASVAVGVEGIFIETHDNPDTALSDGANMIPVAELKGLIESLLEIHAVIKNTL